MDTHQPQQMSPQGQLVMVNIRNYNTKCDTFVKEFENTCDFEEVKEHYIHQLDLINIIDNFDKSKLYFFTDTFVIRPNTQILKVMETGRIRFYVIALYDYDNNFSDSNTFMWLSNIKYGNYYMFCPQTMTMREVIQKYENHLVCNHNNVIKPKRTILLNAGRKVDEEETVEKYSQTSRYAVFVVQIYDNLPVGLKILLVGNSRTIVKLSSILSNMLRHQVYRAGTSAMAVEMLEDSLLLKREDNHEISEESSVEVMPMSNDEEGQMLKKFDVIFIDLELGVDGFETARRIRDIEKTKLATSNTTAAVSLHHVIIGITMNNDHDTIELASEAGFDSFLPQSFDLQKVMATLKETELSRH